eukprot:5243117-Amphidinium_carterae.1
MEAEELDPGAGNTEAGLQEAVAAARTDYTGLPRPRLRWGGFTIGITRDRSGKFALEAICPYHARNDVTGCKKRLNLPNREDGTVQTGTNVLKWWCLQAVTHTRQRTHVGMYLSLDMDVPATA